MFQDQTMVTVTTVSSIIPTCASNLELDFQSSWSISDFHRKIHTHITKIITFIDMLLSPNMKPHSLLMWVVIAVVF